MFKAINDNSQGKTGQDLGKTGPERQVNHRPDVMPNMMITGAAITGQNMSDKREFKFVLGQVTRYHRTRSATGVHGSAVARCLAGVG